MSQTINKINDKKQNPNEIPSAVLTLSCLAEGSLPLAVAVVVQPELLAVVRERFSGGVGLGSDVSVLALVRRAGVGHLHLMPSLRQWLVRFGVHLFHVRRGPAEVLIHSYLSSTVSTKESEKKRDRKRDGGERERETLFALFV